MQTIYKSQLPGPETEVRSELALYKAAMAAHALTVGEPAPFPMWDILRQLETGFVVIDDVPQNVEQEPTIKTFPEIKIDLVNKIDDYISNIYNKFTRFALEYENREAAARAFKAANYEGEASLWVTAFATNAGVSVPLAADIIIEQSDQLRGALVQLGAIRMRKYGINTAVNEVAATELYDDIIASANLVASAL